MRELLERWAELEPAWCNVDGERASVMTDVGAPLERPRFTAQFHRLGQYEPHILAAVIEAITARGWSWEIRGSGCPASARVTAAEGTYRCIADEPTDPPAFPLLAAYLKALEAEADQ